MAIPAIRALGNEDIPAITAAARARVMVLGPRFVIPVSEPLLPDRRRSETLERAPATVQTKSETTFGLIPDNFAKSALFAEA